MLSLFTIPNWRIDYGLVRSVFARKRVYGIQKNKSIRQTRSDKQLTRDPSLREVHLPPPTPRKRAGPVSRQTSSIRLRAGALRAKRLNARKKQPAKQPPPKTYPIPDAEIRHKFRPETTQDKLDTAYEHAQRRIPRPRTLADTVFIEQMAKLNVRHSFLTENFKNRVRLNEAEKSVGERLRQQAEHDVRAKELRAKLKQQQQQTAPRRDTFAKPRSTTSSKPKPLVVRESVIWNWAQQEQVYKDDAAWRAHKARIDAGELPPTARLPVKGEWSLWEKVRIGLDRTVAEIQEERQRKEEAARAREAAALAEQERLRRQTAQQQAEERNRAAWQERLRKEMELEAEMKAAEEEDARRKAAQEEVNHIFLPSVPPQCSDPEEYVWVMYERRWAAIKHESTETVPTLTFDMIPWPQARDAYTVNDLCEDHIRHFLLSTRRPGNHAKNAKERLRRELLLFHPDKFNARVLPYVEEVNWAQVVEGAVRVTVILHSLLQTIGGRCA